MSYYTVDLTRNATLLVALASHGAPVREVDEPRAWVFVIDETAATVAVVTIQLVIHQFMMDV